MEKEDPDFTELAGLRVAIAGLGLMGGSLALALRGRCRELLGFDLDPAVIETAFRREVVDRASTDPQEILPRADLVVLAAPVGAILELLDALPDLHPGSPVVLDLGSTKAQICRAMEGLPERFDPLGGHPICGKERSGLDHADAGLFLEAAFAFTPLERSSRQARSLAAGLAQVIGAHPVWIDPATHDRWVASTSHLPYLVAHALAGATPIQAGTLAGPGFRSATRLAAEASPMMLAVLRANREEILAALGSFKAQLAAIEDRLDRGDYAALDETLAGSALRREQLLQQDPREA